MNSTLTLFEDINIILGNIFKNCKRNIIKKFKKYKKIITIILFILIEEAKEHKIKFVCFTLAIISIFILVFMPTKKVSADCNENYKYKYYHTITVQAGDTLWSIANDNKNNESTQKFINEIIKLNHLSSDKIIEGQVIVVPYYSTEYIL